MNKFWSILIASSLLTSCADLFEPAIENNKDITSGQNDPAYAEGILANAYTRNPYNSQSFNDVATDDAVTNQTANSYLKMATGSWTSNNNPMDQWGSCKAAIQYINLFLSQVDNVSWADDELVNEMFRDRLKGEAYGLRAMFTFYLLQAHGGWTEDGKLLGVPVILTAEDNNSNFNVARNTFDECIKYIYDDVEAANKCLPLDFEDLSSDAEVPEKYRSKGVSSSQYNRVFGKNFRTRMSGRIAMAFKAKAALLGASDAFREGTTVTWEDAANYNGELLKMIGGVDGGFDWTGNTWYKNKDEIANLGAGENTKEMLWRNGKETNTYSLEQAQFPPSLFGGGQINPTQNLVDAFPMANGYPINDENSDYDEANPYANRDPRLNLYIVVNGSTLGIDNKVIDTSADNKTNNDGLNKEDGVSTRTGYYLRKHLREDVSITSTSQNGQPHYSPRIRYTEIFLNYAEAANEAWGPTGTGDFNFSAYDVIKAIRVRAGVGQDNGDAYLESIKGDKDKMRELICNERRLELCFEGFRFWDLRRWKLDMNETAKGIRFSGNTYTIIDVENRKYEDYMNYGPIPYTETLKFDALVQNKGWK